MAVSGNKNRKSDRKQKRHISACHIIRSGIRVHCEHHKRIRPEIAGALCNYAKTYDAAEQGKDDRNGKTPDDHGK